ncbi:MAG: acetyl-CoA carboxylase biotin carboxylase subunit family protein [Eubacterium sp.]
MKALVLAGGFPQIALLQELRRRNIVTVLADYYEKPVAKDYADKFYRVSTLDVEAITDVAKKENVDFLITACTDQALLTVAKVSDELGLPCYIDYETAMNVTNKAYMKQVFKENDISTAKYEIMGELDTDKIKDMRYPLIVKPVDCNSSKGVRRVENPDELHTYFNDAVQMSRTDTAIVEEYIEGAELTADVYVENGKAHLLVLSNNEKIAEKDKFVIFRTVYPAAINDEIYKQVEIIAQQIADAFGLVNSPMLIQMITDGKKVYVLEFSARTGGGLKYRLIEKISGFDVIKAVVDLTLGLKPHVDKKAPESKYIANEFIYCKPGFYDRLEGFEELKNQGILSEYCVFKWKGAEFDSINNSGDRIAGFVIQADTFEDFNKKHCIARDNLKVLDENSNDIMRHDLLPDFTDYKAEGDKNL